MATLRLIEPHEPAVPQDNTSASQNGAAASRPTTRDDLPVTGDVRIHLGSLPTPLRAVVREQSDDGITIAAELPWLAVGTPLQVQSPHGERAASVQSFDVEVTSAGSACLLIFAAPAAGLPAAIATSRAIAPRAARRRRWPLLAAAVLVCAAAVGGYEAGQRASAPPPPAATAMSPSPAPVVPAPEKTVAPPQEPRAVASPTPVLDDPPAPPPPPWRARLKARARRK
jgi:hypothetical protein